MFRLAFRSLAKAPGFTFIAILTLALGISMSTASFSIANAIVFRSLPFQKSKELFSVFRTTPQNDSMSHSPGNFLELKENLTSFSAFSAFYQRYSSYVPEGQPAQQTLALSATVDLMETLGIQPMLGRGFARDDDKPGSARSVILTHRMWTKRCGSDPEVIGKSLRIDGQSHVVLGVMPASFDILTLFGPVELITPMTIWPDFRNQRASKWFSIVGRLKSGVSEAQAQSELAMIVARMNQEHPVHNSKDGIRMHSLSTAFVGSLNTSISYLIIALSCMVLLIACANLASIQIARSFERAREYAIRSALGARRIHLMMPLLAESCLLSLAGGGLGLVLASWTVELLGNSIVLYSNERGFDIPIDGHVLVFAVLSSIGTVIASGLIPAWIASKGNCIDALKEGSRTSSSGTSHKRTKHILVIIELALSLILVGVASSFSLAIRSFMNRDLGWNPAPLASGSLSLPYERYTTPELRKAFQDKVLASVEQIPGVEHATLAHNLPLSSYYGSNYIVIEGQMTAIPGQEPLSQMVPATSDYFEVLGIPLAKGRLFAPGIKASDPAVVVINESMANRFWPNQDPIGKRLRIREDQIWMEVIGVVRDVRMAVGLVPTNTRFQMYRPLAQAQTSHFDIILKTSANPESLIAPMRQAVSRLDPDLPVLNAGAATRLIRDNLGNFVILTNQMSLFAVMGLLISALSVYGVISHMTAQRTREFGVRIALGADSTSILGSTLIQGVWLLVFGLALGLAGSFALGRILQSMLSEMSMPGVWLQVIAALLLVVVTLIACLIPARRATRIDPVLALRAE